MFWHSTSTLAKCWWNAWRHTSQPMLKKPGRHGSKRLTSTESVCHRRVTTSEWWSYAIIKLLSKNFCWDMRYCIVLTELNGVILWSLVYVCIYVCHEISPRTNGWTKKHNFVRTYACRETKFAYFHRNCESS